MSFPAVLSPNPAEPQGPAVLSGTVDRVVFRKPETGFVIARVRPESGGEPISVVGVAEALIAGEMVRAEGRYEVDKSWGRQFRASRITVVPPADDDAMISFLASGVVKGVGKKVADKLRERFGADLLHVIEREPEKLTAVRGIGKVTARSIHQGWTEEKGGRDILLFLHAHGVKPRRARKILELYGDTAVTRILEDPYLLAREVRGIGFETADALAQRLNIPKDADVRLTAALAEALRRAGEDGHSALPRAEVVERAAAFLAVEPEAAEAALEIAVERKRVVEVEAAGESYLMLPELRRAEAAIAARLHELLAEPAPWAARAGVLAGAAERALSIELAGSQRQALQLLLSSKAAVLTGGPGTGKTTLVRSLLKALDGVAAKVKLAAPTGRAARRLSDSTKRTATTLHRLLEADPARGFARGRDNRLEVDLLVVDEVSMVDLPLMAAMLQALPDGAVLVLVGDADQLPPVGPGQVLADLIASGVVPVARLTEVFRQAARSDIVRSAYDVISGRMPLFKGGDGEEPDAFGIRAFDPEDAVAKVVDLVGARIPERFGFDPIEQIQVLTAVNRGPCGTRALNERLQQALNPDPAAKIEHRGQRLGLADKVMQTENDHQREIYNGDIGRVLRLDPRTRKLTVGFEEREVPLTGEALDGLVPAYAVTVHKAQGSEYPCVVLLLMREFGRMLRRRLLYTAMTRAQKLLIVVAHPQALERAVAVAEPPRRSLLRHEIALTFGPDPAAAPTTNGTG